MAPSGGAGGMSFSDRFFSYETFKVLRVRDRRLGGLYRLFQATILVYIASSIIIQQRYLKTENVINGAVRVTLKAPADGIATPDYCKSTPPDCLYWSENDILYEPGIDGALITTRTQITQYGPFVNQTLGADPDSNSECDVNIATIPGCDPYKAPSTLLLPTSLVADIERFTLMLEHSIRGQATGVQIRSGNMESGILRDSATGQALKTFTDQSRYVPAPARSGVSNSTISSGDGNRIRLAGDVMTVGEFLKAAGVNLDELSGAPTASVNETVRTSGVVVIVVIQYAAKGWNPNRISYEYLPKAIPDQEYKVIETIRDFKGGSRVEINRHGVRIVFSQTGQLGQFSLMTLLTNLVAAVALFKVANIIVELMMLRLHPQKKIYKGAKFEHTEGSTLQRKDRINDGRASTTPASTELDHDSNARSDQMEQGAVNLRALDPKSLQGGISRTQAADTDTGEEENACSGSYQESDRDNERRGYHDTESDSNSSESDSDDRNQTICAGAGTTTIARQNISDSGKRGRRTLSIQTGQTFFSTGMAAVSKSTLTCRPRTPISNNGTLGRSQRSMDKRGSYHAQVDWNRNGSSSALNGDVLPGVANAITRLGSGSSRVTNTDGEEMEIETRYGPVNLHGRSSFNPGGLSLSGIPPHTQLDLTPPRSRTPFSFPLDISTPEYRQVAMSPSYTCQASPASMQAVSPSPVFFGPESTSPGPTASSMRGPRPKFGEDQKQDIASSSRTTLPLRRTSSSSASLASSSSNLSLSSLLDGPVLRLRECSIRINDPKSPEVPPASRISRIRQKTPRTQLTTATGNPSLSQSSTHLERRNSFSTTKKERKLDKGKAAAILDSTDTRPQSVSFCQEVPTTDCSVATPSFLSQLPSFPTMDDSFLVSIGSTSSLLPATATTISNSNSITPTSSIAGTRINSRVHTTLRPPYSSAFVARSESVATVLTQDQMPHSNCSECHQGSPVRTELSRSHSEESFETSSTSLSSLGCPRRSSTTVESRPRIFSVGDHTIRQSHGNIGPSLSSPVMPVSGEINLHTSSATPRSTDLILGHTLPEADPITHADATLHSIDIADSGDYVEPVSTIGLAETGCYSSDFLQHPTSAFFSSPITSACTTTLPGTGIRVLGRAIRMITEDNTELVLCRSEPLILNEGVGEEKAARM